MNQMMDDLLRKVGSLDLASIQAEALSNDYSANPVEVALLLAQREFIIMLKEVQGGIES
ncbi:MAG: hypothetical protein GTO49_16165 [Anaerolineae bacterium]|nr:hypothetical protein [Anaerolineae bacterium]